MATTVEINGNPGSFNLKSSWSVSSSSQGAVYTQQPTVDTKTVYFTVNLPSGAIVNKCYIHSEWGNPNTGYAIKTVNGTVPRMENGYNVSVSLATTNGSNGYEFKFKANGSLLNPGKHSSIAGISNVYMHIEYTMPYTNPTAPTSVIISKATAAPGGTATLSWSGAVGGTDNPITSYSVYLSTSETGTYSYLTGASTSSGSGSCTVAAPTTNGSAYYYKVLVSGSVSGYENSALSSSYATFTCSYSAPEAPSNVRITSSKNGTQKTSLSVGAHSDSNFTITLSWNASSSGTNNAVKSYTIYRDGTSIASISNTVTEYQISDMSIILANHSYTVQAIGTISGSDSSVSSSVTTSLQSAPASVSSITSSYENGHAYNSTTLSWGAISDCSYLLSETNSGYFSTVTSTSKVIYLVDDLGLSSAGSTATIYITARKNAADGGYTDAAASSFILTKTGDISISDRIWYSYFDNNSSYCNEQYSTIGVYLNSSYYTSILLVLRELKKEYEYQLEVSYDNYTYNYITTFSSITNAEYTFTPDNSTRIVYFRMKIKDKYGAEAYTYPMASNELGQTFVVSFNKVLQPVILLLKTTSMAARSYTVQYLLEEHPQILTTDLRGYVEFLYRDEVVYTSSHFSINALSDYYSESNINFLTVGNILYNYINTQFIRYPTGTVKLYIYPYQFPNCIKSLSANMVYNFDRSIAPITESDYILTTLYGSESYANSAQTLYYSLSESGKNNMYVYTDALAGHFENDPPIEYSITYNQNNTSISRIYSGETDIPFFINTVAFDTSATFSLSALIKYNNEDGTADYQTVLMGTKTIPIAAWSEKTIQITKNEYENGYLKISSSLPAGYCGSTKYNNASLNYVDVIINGNRISLNEEYYKANTDSLTISYPYELNSGNHRVYIEVGFINTYNAELSLISKTYTIRIGGIDFSVRKGRVGVNILPTFAPGGVKNTDSTVYINAHDGSESAVSTIDINSLLNAENGPSIRFLEDGEEIGKIKIYRNEVEGKNYMVFEGLKQIDQDVRTTSEVVFKKVEADTVIGAVYQ